MVKKTREGMMWRAANPEDHHPAERNQNLIDRRLSSRLSRGFELPRYVPRAHVAPWFSLGSVVTFEGGVPGSVRPVSRRRKLSTLTSSPL